QGLRGFDPPAGRASAAAEDAAAFARVAAARRAPRCGPRDRSRSARDFVYQRPAQPGLVYLSDVALLAGGERVASWPLDSGAFDAGRGSHLEREGTSWGEIAVWQGRVCWPMRNYGSP